MVFELVFGLRDVATQELICILLRLVFTSDGVGVGVVVGVIRELMI